MLTSANVDKLCPWKGSQRPRIKSAVTTTATSNIELSSSEIPAD